MLRVTCPTERYQSFGRVGCVIKYMEQEFSSLGDIFQGAKSRKKPPAHPWQDLALEVIAKLGVPNFKRNSVFKVCKNNSPTVVRRALNDTLELCESGAKWKYFFKIIDNIPK